MAALTLLKAGADPTRLRLLAVLARGEATVGELVEVLGQSQPRVSRHLRLLAEAGLVSHFRDGQWVYYRFDPTPAAAPLAGQALVLAGAGDATITADEARMAAVRRRRERYALTVPAPARLWAEAAGDRPDEPALAQALAGVLGGGPLGDVLDVGVGSGALLRLLAPRARSAVGVDTVRRMRVLARSRLQQAGLAHCTVRAGDMCALPFPDLSFDIVVLDEVLGSAVAPQRAIEEAVRVLRPAGRLLVLDRILPAVRRLPGQPPRQALFENQLVVMLREAGLRPGAPAWFPGRSLQYALLQASPAPSRTRNGTHD
ncbi:MAG: metalloregulator ArsR/SmtB family transcription factor [Gammaproteobacteria bacterium]|nr:metalloregulator ArsR/SmtB family transcription factor [Gammaproteobacteria bacterium]